LGKGKEMEMEMEMEMERNTALITEVALIFQVSAHYNKPQFERDPENK
jgi:hypothetical protein